MQLIFCFFMLHYKWKTEKGIDSMNKKTLEFAIFCIEEIAAELHKSGNEVYDMLTKQSDILFSYIVPSYDVLHTQSKEYIVEDIISFMQEEGVLS